MVANKIISSARFWPFLTDHMSYFKAREMPVLPLYQLHKERYIGIQQKISAYLLLLKPKKLFQKVRKNTGISTICLFSEIPWIIYQWTKD